MILDEIIDRVSDAGWLVIRACSDSELAKDRVAVIAAGLQQAARPRCSLAAVECIDLFGFLLWLRLGAGILARTANGPIAKRVTRIATVPSRAVPTC